MISTGTEVYGTLYICPTPIGNLKDITYRVVETLREVSLIAAEDTRNSRKLLDHFGIETPMTSYHEHNRFEKAEGLLEVLRSGKDVAVITDAGTPCISDPGEVLVRRCAEDGIRVIPLPGPSACVTALSASGLSTSNFLFVGFLPRETRDRKKVLSRLRDETATMILYEAPHRYNRTVGDLKEVLGKDRKISICRELTKKYEEIIRTDLENADLPDPKGEFVLILEGKSEEALKNEQVSDLLSLSVMEHVAHYTDAGMDRKEAIKAAAADRGVSRREIYNEVNR